MPETGSGSLKISMSALRTIDKKGLYAYLNELGVSPQQANVGE